MERQLFVIYDNNYKIRSTRMSYGKAWIMKNKLNEAFGFEKFKIGELVYDKNKLIRVDPKELINEKNINRNR